VARIAAESVSDRLASWKVERTTYWGADSAHSLLPVKGVRLLAGFDEYLLGYKDRSLVLDPQHATLVVPGKNGVFKPLVVHDGRIVGTWRRQLKARRVEIAFEPFEGPLSQPALKSEAEQYARFLDLELALV
jgi:hypothetical protein